MYVIRYADIDDAKIVGEIHSQSWKVVYKGIVPDEILNNITAEKRQKYFEKIGFDNDGTIKEITIGKILNEYRYIKVIQKNIL